MADESDDSDKTEEPTQRRLQEAHDKADVVKSMEVATFFGLASILLAIGVSGGLTSEALVTPMRGLVEHSVDITLDGSALHRLYLRVIVSIAVALAAPMAILASPLLIRLHSSKRCPAVSLLCMMASLIPVSAVASAAAHDGCASVMFVIW